MQSTYDSASPLLFLTAIESSTGQSEVPALLMAVTLGDVWALAWLAYPATVFLLFVTLLFFHWFQSRRAGYHIRVLRHVSIILALSASFVLSLSQAIVTSLLPPDPGISAALEDIIVGQVACALVFGAQLGQMLDANAPPFLAFLGSWLLSLFWEVFLGSWAIAARPTAHPMLPSDVANLILTGLKGILLVMLISLAILLPRARRDSCIPNAECQPLLFAENLATNSSNTQSRGDFAAYGSTRGNAQGCNAATSSYEHRRSTTVETGASAHPHCSDINYDTPRIISSTVVSPFMSRQYMTHISP